MIDKLDRRLFPQTALAIASAHPVRKTTSDHEVGIIQKWQCMGKTIHEFLKSIQHEFSPSSQCCHPPINGRLRLLPKQIDVFLSQQEPRPRQNCELVGPATDKHSYIQQKRDSLTPNAEHFSTKACGAQTEWNQLISVHNI